MGKRGEATDPREVIDHLQLSLSEEITARAAAEKRVADLEKALCAARGQLSMRSGEGWLPPVEVEALLIDLRERLAAKFDASKEPWARLIAQEIRNEPLRREGGGK